MALPLVPLVIPPLSSPAALIILATLHARGGDEKIADIVEELYGKLDRNVLQKVSEKIEAISTDDLRDLLKSLPQDVLGGMTAERKAEIVKKIGEDLKHRFRVGEPPVDQKKDDTPPPPGPHI